MDGRGGTAELTEPGATLTYGIAATKGAQTVLTLTANIDGYRYVVPLLLEKENPIEFGGTEIITGPDGCQAQYHWFVRLP